MSGKIKRSIYPCVEQEKNLPLYLTGSRLRNIADATVELSGKNISNCAR